MFVTFLVFRPAYKLRKSCTFLCGCAEAAYLILKAVEKVNILFY